MVFKTGKMIVTGAKTVASSELASKKYASIIRNAGFNARFENFAIQNMTASCDVGFPISLEGLLYAHAQFCTYEPELFPGLIYRMTDPKIVFLVFVSGKLVITGAKSEETLMEALQNMYPILLDFRKKNALLIPLAASAGGASGR